MLQRQKTQNPLSILQRKGLSASQMISQAKNAYQNSVSFRAVLDAAKPDKITEIMLAAGYRAWASILTDHRVILIRQNKLQFSIGFVFFEGLHWWELLTLQHISTDTY